MSSFLRYFYGAEAPASSIMALCDKRIAFAAPVCNGVGQHSINTDLCQGRRTAAKMLSSTAYTTLNIYTQVLQDSVKVAVNRIGEELFTIVHLGEREEGLSS